MDKPRSSAPIIAAMLLLLPVLYVGSYLVLVVPGGYWIYKSPGPIEFAASRIPREHYRYEGRLADSFYWPLEQIDRRVRPKAWEEREEHPSWTGANPDP